MSSYEFYIDNENRLIKVFVEGEVFQSAGEEIITKAREQATDLEYNILYDMRAATTTVDFVSWYNLPRDLDVFHRSGARRIKVAVIIAKTDKALEGYRFYESVTDNLGFRLRIFFDEPEAFKWLAT